MEDGFNIDHALVGPGGVFVIETKTVSKPTDGDPVITYDGEQVLVGGFAPDRDPIKQAQALTRRLSEILQKATDRKPPMRGVVLYPGWFVQRQPRNCEIWVLNPKVFLIFIENEPTKLSEEDVKSFASSLSTYVRSKNTK